MNATESCGLRISVGIGRSAGSASHKTWQPFLGPSDQEGLPPTKDQTMSEYVRTILIEGKERVVPDGVDIEIKYPDGYGGLHKTAEEAVYVKAINDAEELITQAIHWGAEEFDMQHILDNRAELIRLLNIIQN